MVLIDVDSVVRVDVCLDSIDPAVDDYSNVNPTELGGGASAESKSIQVVKNGEVVSIECHKKLGNKHEQRKKLVQEFDDVASDKLFTTSVGPTKKMIGSTITLDTKTKNRHKSSSPSKTKSSKRKKSSKRINATKSSPKENPNSLPTIREDPTVLSGDEYSSQDDSETALQTSHSTVSTFDSEEDYKEAKRKHLMCLKLETTLLDPEICDKFDYDECLEMVKNYRSRVRQVAIGSNDDTFKPSRNPAAGTRAVSTARNETLLGPIDYDEELSKNTVDFYDDDSDDDDKSDGDSEVAYVMCSGMKPYTVKKSRRCDGAGFNCFSNPAVKYRKAKTVAFVFLCITFVAALIGAVVYWTQEKSQPSYNTLQFEPLYIKAGIDMHEAYVEADTNITWISDEKFSSEEAVQASQVYKGCDNDLGFVLPASGNNDRPWDATLYCTERWFSSNVSALYEVPVLPIKSKYDVKLYFNELFFGSNGERLFDIEIEGTLVEEQFDIFKEAGSEKYTLVLVNHESIVSDGSLTIKLIHKKNDVKINAISVTLVATEESLKWMWEGRSQRTKISTSRFALVEPKNTPIIYNWTQGLPGLSTETDSQSSMIQNTGNNSSNKLPLSVQQSNPLSNQSIFINAGGDDSQLYISGDGQIWTSDTTYIDDSKATGYSYDVCPSLVSNLGFDDIHNRIGCCERVFDQVGEYEIPIPVPSIVTTKYKYVLVFVELDDVQEGDRLFNIVIEDEIVKSNFDIYKEAGGKSIAYTLAGEITVQDTGITIQLVPVVGNATISAIEIYPLNDS